MWRALKRMVRDFAWGVDSAHAVWHGVPIRSAERGRAESASADAGRDCRPQTEGDT